MRLLANADDTDVSYRQIYDLVRGKDFIAGYGEEGFRVNVRSFIKRIRQKFRDVDDSFSCIENYPGIRLSLGGRRIIGPRMDAPSSRRVERSLASKLILLIIVFLAVPVALYQTFKGRSKTGRRC